MDPIDRVIGDLRQGHSPWASRSRPLSFVTNQTVDHGGSLAAEIRARE
jgi:hypothetical protein